MKKNLVILLLTALFACCVFGLIGCETSIHTHELETVSAVSATCETDGNIEYYRCKGCKKIFADENYTEISAEKTVITALGHDEVSHDAKSATCTEAGWKAYVTCSRCDYTTKVEIPALGHSYDEKVTTPATCVSKGVKTYTCKHAGCGHSYTEKIAIDPNAHDLEHHEKVDATCTKDGTIEYWSCSLCNKNFSDKAGANEVESVVIKALGHDFNGTETIITNATCQSAGSKTVKCTRCDETTTVEIEIDSTAHDLTHHDGKTATCTEAGWKEYYTCKYEGCKYTTYKEIPALNHDYKETTIEPNGDESGYILHKCSRCEDEYKDGYFKYYRFEAENAISNAWADGTNWLWRWYDKDMASGNCYVGHISDSAIQVPGQSYMSFVVNAEKAVTTSLYASFGFADNSNSLLSSAFTVTVNGVALTKLGNDEGNIVSVDSSYTGGWENFTLVKLSDEVTLNEGINVIVITVNEGASCNMDYIEFASSDKLESVNIEHDCSHRCPVCGKCKDDDCTEYSCLIKCECEEGKTYRFEAENAASNAWSANEGGTDWLWKWNNLTDTTSNGWYVGHISDSAYNVPGESWMSFTFNSSTASNASLSMCLTLPDGFIVNTAFTIEINGTVVAKVGNSDGKIVPDDSDYVNDWNNFTLCYVSDDITLKEGENVLKITVNGGATCNMDYIELTTTTTITGNK